MTQVAKIDSASGELLRVYLVPADRVAEFHDLVNAATEAAQGDNRDDELRALWRLVGNSVQAFEAAQIVKVRFK
ncbi:hypothetical protein [Micromonospora sp. WMMD736]|uniref:hypothetical protein n=1 Tax=Micromonospora sp. WMMD736 TaxID=3404112 RepID=UPI003B928801